MEQELKRGRVVVDVVRLGYTFGQKARLISLRLSLCFYCFRYTIG